MVYQTIAVLFSSTVDLVSYTTVKELVCRSRDLIESLEVQNTTPFCIFEGKTFAIYKIILEYSVVNHSIGVLRMRKSPLLNVVQ